MLEQGEELRNVSEYSDGNIFFQKGDSVESYARPAIERENEITAIYLRGHEREYDNDIDTAKFASLTDRDTALRSYCELLHAAAEANGWDLQINGDVIEPNAEPAPGTVGWLRLAMKDMKPTDEIFIEENEEEGSANHCRGFEIQIRNDTRERIIILKHIAKF